MWDLDPNQKRRPVKVVNVANPMQPVTSKTEWVYPYIGNGSIRDYIPSAVRVTNSTVIYQNGHVIPPDRWHNRGVSPGDFIQIGSVPGAFGTALLISLIVTVISTGLQYLASLFIDSPKQPDDTLSPTYGSAEIRTQEANGKVIPIVYGEHVVGGNLIKATTGHATGQTQKTGSYQVDVGGFRSNLQLGLCGGPIKSIGGISNDINQAWLNKRETQSRVQYGQLGLTPDQNAILRYSSSYELAAFRFIVTETMIEINSITLNLKRVGTIASGKKVSVWIAGDAASAPSSTTPGQTMSTDADAIPKAYKRVRFAPKDPIVIPAGTYWVVISGDYDLSTSNYIDIGGKYYSPAAGAAGELKHYNGAAWSSYAVGTAAWLAVAEVTQHIVPWYSVSADIKVNGTDAADYLPKGQISTRRGSLNQEALPGSSDVIEEQILNHTLALSNTYEETTQNEVDGVGVVFYFPGGIYHSGGGGRVPTIFGADIRVRANGNSNPWSKIYRAERKFISLSATGITLRLDFPTDKKSPLHSLRGQLVDVEVTPYYLPAQTVYWKSIREYSDDQAQIYPHVALLQVEAGFGTAQGPLENITTLIEGKEMNVYNGSSWNFQYSANPADCCLDYLLNTRVGGGNVLTLANVDLDAFVDWRDYCAEDISDGNGGTMDRWELGLVIDQPKPFWDWATTISAAGRCKLVWDGNKIRPKIEKAVSDSDVAMVISAGNTVLGTYQRRWLGKKKRPNAVDLSYLDADLDFAEAIASAEEPSLRASGEPDLREKMDFRGCTNRIRATRQAKYLLNLIRDTDWIAEVDMFVEAMACEPGDVVFISNDAVDTEGIGGRLKENAPDSTSIVLDRDLTIEADKNYQVTVRVVTGGADTTVTATVVEDAGTYVAGTTINTSPSWTTTPQAGDVYTVKPYDDTGSGLPETEPGGERARVISTKLTDDGFVRLKVANFTNDVFLDDPGNLPQPPVPNPLDGKVIPPRPTGLALKPEYSGGKLRLVATWLKTPWPYKYDCNVWLKQFDANRQGEFIWKAKDSGEYWAIEGVQEGYEYEVAITPLAPWTHQHHDPESKFATRKSIIVKRGNNELRGAQITGLSF